MSKATTHRVIYKPDSQSTTEYSVFVDHDVYERWRTDKSVPLVEVVEVPQVYHSTQGSQGQMGKASQQQLDTLFGTSEDGEPAKRVKEDDAIQYILEKGTLKAGGAIGKGPVGLNQSRGGNYVDTRGSGGSLRG